MFQVLIADDEPSVIASLKKSIAWNQLGLELADCASGSREVLEIIEHKRIDIAILDIRMPGLSGLELCDLLRRRFENIQLIIISGHAEFSYAERAIHYGVLGYCLKPLEYEKLTKLLMKAVKNMKKENLPVLSGVELLDAIECGANAEASEILRQMGVCGDTYYVAVTSGVEKLSVLPGEGICLLLGRGQYGYILVRPMTEEEILVYLALPGSQGLGYSAGPVGINGLSNAFQDCMVQACQFFVDSNGQAVGAADEQQAGELLEGIQQNVEKNRWEAVCDQLLVIDDKYRHCFNVRSATRLCNMIHTSSLFREEETDYYIYNLKQLLSDYGSFSNMLKRLREEIISIRTAGDREDNFSNTAFMKLMVYIRENYKNEISLTSAGRAVNMSPNYISQLFKKEAGITFIHYITQLRMEDAILLLTTTRMSVVDISMELGFNDYFYFLKIFKKYTGKTPNQYRNEN